MFRATSFCFSFRHASDEQLPPKLRKNDLAEKHVNGAGELEARLIMRRGRRRRSCVKGVEEFLLTLQSSASLIAHYVPLKESARGVAVVLKLQKNKSSSERGKNTGERPSQE